MDLNTLPESALFTRYHVSQNISQADIDSAISGVSLAVSPESNIAETLQAINKSLVADVRNGVLDKIAITQKNYNSVTFSVTAAKPSLFFWRMHATHTGMPKLMVGKRKF